jgi:hypothetical protein
VYSIYLLLEDFSLSITLITQGKTIDVIAIAMILLDAGSGESPGKQKG